MLKKIFIVLIALAPWYVQASVNTKKELNPNAKPFVPAAITPRYAQPVVSFDNKATLSMNDKKIIHALNQSGTNPEAIRDITQYALCLSATCYNNLLDRAYFYAEEYYPTGYQNVVDILNETMQFKGDSLRVVNINSRIHDLLTHPLNFRLIAYLKKNNAALEKELQAKHSIWINQGKWPQDSIKFQYAVNNEAECLLEIKQENVSDVEKTLLQNKFVTCLMHAIESCNDRVVETLFDKTIRNNQDYCRVLSHAIKACKYTDDTYDQSVLSLKSYRSSKNMVDFVLSKKPTGYDINTPFSVDDKQRVTTTVLFELLDDNYQHERDCGFLKTLLQDGADPLKGRISQEWDCTVTTNCLQVATSKLPLEELMPLVSNISAKDKDAQSILQSCKSWVSTQPWSDVAKTAYSQMFDEKLQCFPKKSTKPEPLNPDVILKPDVIDDALDVLSMSFRGTTPIPTPCCGGNSPLLSEYEPGLLLAIQSKRL